MTLQQALQEAQTQLARAGITEPHREAWILLAALLNQSRAWVMSHPQATLTPHQQRRLHRWLQRRAQREPLPYITHRRWFYGLELEIRRGVLIPRPETELLVARFLEWARTTTPPHETRTLVDAGTGSGAIALACLTHAPNWQAIGTDRSLRALQIANKNRQKFGISQRFLLARMHWLSALRSHSVHAVLSNPPYVLPEEWSALEPEITHWEPRTALLVPQQDPLQPYRELAHQARSVLVSGGLLLMEISPHRAYALCDLLVQLGYCAVQSYADLAGHLRIVQGFVE